MKPEDSDEQIGKDAADENCRVAFKELDNLEKDIRKGTVR